MCRIKVSAFGAQEFTIGRSLTFSSVARGQFDSDPRLQSLPESGHYTLTTPALHCWHTFTVDPENRASSRLTLQNDSAVENGFLTSPSDKLLQVLRITRSLNGDFRC